jgi:hypothetical protein
MQCWPRLLVYSCPRTRPEIATRRLWRIRWSREEARMNAQEITVTVLDPIGERQ